MSDDTTSGLITTLKDWRVAVMLLLVVFSVVSIYVIPPGISNGMTGILTGYAGGAKRRVTIPPMV
jgi:preprotein translocase subunit SecD